MNTNGKETLMSTGEIGTEAPAVKLLQDPAKALEIKHAADKFLEWQREHIAAADHNLVVSTVYAVTSHFKSSVPVMPNLVFYATMNTSGNLPLRKR